MCVHFIYEEKFETLSYLLVLCLNLLSSEEYCIVPMCWLVSRGYNFITTNI